MHRANCKSGAKDHKVMWKPRSVSPFGAGACGGLRWRGGGGLGESKGVSKGSKTLRPLAAVGL